jgi:RimJ/RimL family protein N-acetyltransferase
MVRRFRRVYDDSDRAAVRDHLLRLQGDDRRMRFGGAISDEGIDVYLKTAFDRNSEWFIIYSSDVVVAACHVAYIEDEAEIGLSVDVTERMKKLAQVVFRRALISVRAKNIKKVYMHCLSENTVMKHIAHKAGMTVVSAHGESDARIEVDYAYPLMNAYIDANLNTVALIDRIVSSNLEVIRNLFKMEALNER